MSTRTISVLMLALGATTIAHANKVTLEDTIASDPFHQTTVLTGAAPVFGSGGGVVLADGFTAPVNAELYQIAVVVAYEDFPSFGVTGTSPMLLTLFNDSGNSPGTPIEAWIVPLSPSDTSLTLITVNSITNALLLAGREYWLSVVPTDPVHTGIGWGLDYSAGGYPAAELPITETTTGVNSGWLPTALNLANEFSVSGTAVPEPPTFWTTAFVCLAVVGGLRTSNRRDSARQKP
jgi:hypothetical protein